MPTKKIRILGIAPYEGIQTLMEKAAAVYPQIELDALTGDLQKGVEAAQDHFHSNYDVIISRGGTAQLLREQVALPVIEIPITEYDILRALHLAENVSEQFALVGFSNVTENAQHLSELLSVAPQIFCIANVDSVEETVMEAYRCGYRTVLCDVVATAAAKRLGMNAVLITSGLESVYKAFNDALLLCHNMENLLAENLFLREVIEGQSNETVVFDENRNLYFSTVTMDNRLAVLEMLKNEIDGCNTQAPSRLIKSLDGILYSIKAQCFHLNSKIYTTFYFSRSKDPFAPGRSGIRYYSHQSAGEVFNSSFYSSAGDTYGMEHEISQLSRSDQPIMLVGESGTGKESMATILYSRGPLRSHPFISINCALLNDKSWDYLQSNHNSPLAQAQVTIYLSQLEALSAERLNQLLAVLIDMNVCRRNHVIFSCTCTEDQKMPPEGIVYADKLCCLTMRLPNLRDCKDRIPALINLFLSQLSMTQASEVIGMEEDAVKIMQDYHWPHNLSQFKRVMHELVATATQPILSLQAVNKALGLEASSPVAQGLYTAPQRFDLNRTMAEMQTDIVQRVLAECDHNQSLAAKRLGISRTTLWRYINRE